MNVSVSGQTVEFLYSALLGVSLAAVYDIFRLARVYLKAGRVMTAFADVVFWLVAVSGLMAFVLGVCDGQMRWYVLVGAFCGAFVYICTVSRLFFRSLDIIIKLCIRILQFAVKPVYFAAEKALDISRRILRRLRKRMRSVKCKSRRRHIDEEGDRCGKRT